MVVDCRGSFFDEHMSSIVTDNTESAKTCKVAKTGPTLVKCCSIDVYLISCVHPHFLKIEKALYVDAMVGWFSFAQ